jgi:hypothetical protein
MAAHEKLDSKTSITSPTFLQHLATVLPKSVSFKIYHLSTPPTKTSALYFPPPGTRRFYSYAFERKCVGNGGSAGLCGGDSDLLDGIRHNVLCLKGRFDRLLTSPGPGEGNTLPYPRHYCHLPSSSCRTAPKTRHSKCHIPLRTRPRPIPFPWKRRIQW